MSTYIFKKKEKKSFNNVNEKVFVYVKIITLKIIALIYSVFNFWFCQFKMNVAQFCSYVSHHNFENIVLILIL